MTIRTCSNCGKSFNRKSVYDNHVNPNRKFPCIISNIISPPNPAKNAPIPAKIPPISAEFAPKLINNKWNCQYCDKNFARNDILKRHQQGRCKKMIENLDEGCDDIKVLKKILEDQNKIIEAQNRNIEAQNKKMEELEKKIEERDIPNTTNNINNGIVNNITNITLVHHGTEEIDAKIAVKAIKKMYCAIQELVRLVHFDQKNPANHNILISHLRENKSLVFKRSKWRVEKANDAINNLYENCRYHLINLFKNDDVRKKLSSDQINRFSNILKETGENPTDYAKGGYDPDEYDVVEKRAKQEVHKARSTEDIKNICWEERDIVLNTKKKVSEQDKIKKELEKEEKKRKAKITI